MCKDMAKHNDLGKWGEDEAAFFLEEEGYVILERDFKVGARDLDIIALSEHEDTLVFVEVKTRQNADMQSPAEAVDVKKVRNLAYAADVYIKRKKIDLEVRFDIVSVIGSECAIQDVEHIEYAFNPMLVL